VVHIVTTGILWIRKVSVSSDRPASTESIDEAEDSWTSLETPAVQWWRAVDVGHLARGCALLRTQSRAPMFVQLLRTHYISHHLCQVLRVLHSHHFLPGQSHFYSVLMYPRDTKIMTSGSHNMHKLTHNNVMPVHGLIRFIFETTHTTLVLVHISPRNLYFI
jgi:hypothetical protein